MRRGYRKNPYPHSYFIGSRFARNSTFGGKIQRIIRRQTWHGRFRHSRHPGRWKKSRSVGLFTLTYPEHLGAAGWADTLSGRPAIFHGYFLRVLHFSLGFAFDTISFHLILSFNFVVLLIHLHHSLCDRVRESRYFTIRYFTIIDKC